MTVKLRCIFYGNNTKRTILPRFFVIGYLSLQDDGLSTQAIGDIRKVVIHDVHRGPKEIDVSREFLSWLTEPVKTAVVQSLILATTERRDIEVYGKTGYIFADKSAQMTVRKGDRNALPEEKKNCGKISQNTNE